MQINLAMQGLPDKAPLGIEKRHPGLIATRFQSQYQHRRRIIPQGLCFTVKNSGFALQNPLSADIMGGSVPALCRVSLYLNQRQ
jgi:hypothetical protein